MATTPSLFPMFLKSKSGDVVTIFGHTVAVEVEEIESILLTEELAVEYVEQIPVEVTDYVEIEVDVCD